MKVRKTASVTFGGSGGIMSTVRRELPYTNVVARPSRDETSRGGGGSNLTMHSHGYIRCAN